MRRVPTMPSYPPEIRYTDFTDPALVQVEDADPGGTDECSMLRLGVVDHLKDNLSFTGNHAPLAPDELGRYRFASSAECVRIGWRIQGVEHVVEAWLDLFVRGRAQPIWRKRIRFQDVTEGIGDTGFNGGLASDLPLDTVNGTDTLVLADRSAAALFPGGFITAARAPYKLKFSITKVKPNTRVAIAARFLYIDVVAALRLSLGPVDWLPPPSSLAYEHTRRHQLQVALHQSLTEQLAGPHYRLDEGAPGELRVPLLHNVFSKSSGDFYNNTLFTGSRLLWGAGPLIPLRASLYLVRADGELADLAHGARGLGELAVLWDWESEARRAHPDPAAQTFIATSLKYKPEDWPHARSNCHVDRGGKRGPLAAPHFVAVAALDAPAHALTAAAQRPWATFSHVITDPTSEARGTTGVLFNPSTIAGDTYRLRLHLAYPDVAALDLPPSPQFQEATAAAASVTCQSCLTIWRRVQVARLWRKNGTVDVDALDWAAVQRHFAAAFVQLDPPAGPQDIPAAAWQQAVQRVRATVPLALHCALADSNVQDQGNHALTFRDYPTFVQTVGQDLLGDYALLEHGRPYPSDRALLIQHIGRLRRPSWYAEDLRVPDRATLGRAEPARTNAVIQQNLGVTDAGSYVAKVTEWGDTLTAKVCAQVTRTLDPGLAGLHLYQFEFQDQWNGVGEVGLAATTVATRDTCAACNQPLPRSAPPMWWDDASSRANRVCAACSFRADDSAVVVTFVPFRYMNGVMDAWAEQNLSVMQRLKIQVGGWYQARASIAVTHEIGHQLGLPHAGPNPQILLISVQKTGGIAESMHVPADDACIMSYNFTRAPALHFCGYCSLRLAGWSIGASRMTQPHDAVHDIATAPLFSDAAQNEGSVPLDGALWQPDSANCRRCNARIGAGTRHHCRICGYLFCNDCSIHKVPIRVPLASAPVARARVCDPCRNLHRPPAPLRPLPFAYWRPDESATECQVPGCGAAFTRTRPRHHCRACGEVVCGDCSAQEVPIENPLSATPVRLARVCEDCYQRTGAG